MLLNTRNVAAALHVLGTSCDSSPNILNWIWFKIFKAYHFFFQTFSFHSTLHYFSLIALWTARLFNSYLVWLTLFTKGLSYRLLDKSKNIGDRTIMFRY